MPLCAVCGSTLSCQKQHSNPLTTPCALRAGALWVHVMDDAGESVSGVNVAVTEKGFRQTVNGFARFDPVESKRYTANLPELTDELAECYELDELSTGAVHPAEGEVAYLGFVILRRPEVTVKVVERGNHTHTFDGAKVSISGTDHDGPEITRGGIARFRRRSKGSYTATVELSAADQQTFFTTPKDDIVPSGDAYEILVEAELRNVVTISIDVSDVHLFFDPVQDSNQAVELQVTVNQTNPEIGHSGKVVIAGAGVAAYLDQGCGEIGKMLSFPQNEPQATRSVWVKKNIAAQGSITASLHDPPSQCFAPSPPAKAAVVIEERNVIHATITGDELVLVNANHGALHTTRSSITVGVAQTQPHQACGDLAVTIAFGAGLTCHNNHGAVNPGAVIPAAQLPMQLQVTGGAEGDCPITVTATGSPGAGYVFAPGATLDVRVEQLKIDAYQFLDGSSALVPNYPTVRVGGAKRRELHVQNPAGDFTVARLVIAAPSQRFWTKASHLTLAASGAVQIYSNPGATVVANALQQADFGTARELDRWVKTTGAVPAMDTLNHVPGMPPVVNVPKAITTCHVTCGATTTSGAKQLVNGDVMALDTFGFDQYLDRLTRESCRTFLTTNAGAAVRKQATAVSLAAGHHHYDLVSARCVNKHYPNVNGGLFAGFIAAMTVPGLAGNAARATAGLAFISNHLLTHGIVLHAGTRTLIRTYLSSQMVPGHATLGFNVNYGVPGLHAEVLSVNAMFNANVPQAQITVATYKVARRNGRAHAGRFPACQNCSGILMNAVRVITG